MPKLNEPRARHRSSARSAELRGHACYGRFSSNRSTTSRAGEVTTPVRITHPFHPLFGQEIAFVERRVRWGDDLIFYRDRHGYVTALPTRWTNVEPKTHSSSYLR